MIKAIWRWTIDIDKEILHQIEGCSGKIANICSGFSGIGNIRIDRFFAPDQKIIKDNRVCGLPNVKADMRRLPIQSGSCSIVICDPPYDMKRYQKEYPVLIDELVRITAPGGKIIWICPWILQHPAIEPTFFWLRKSAAGSNPQYKIMSISVKTNGQLDDYTSGRAG
jgi:hypothetical protein